MPLTIVERLRMKRAEAKARREAEEKERREAEGTSEGTPAASEGASAAPEAVSASSEVAPVASEASTAAAESVPEASEIAVPATEPVDAPTEAVPSSSGGEVATQEAPVVESTPPPAAESANDPPAAEGASESVQATADALANVQLGEDRTEPTPMTAEPFVQSPLVLYQGTAGKTIPLAVNQLTLEFAEGGGIFEHDVEFRPTVDDRKKRFAILAAHRDVLPSQKLFDGKKMLLPMQLKGDRGGDEPRTLRTIDQDVIITFVGKKVKGEIEMCRVVNTLFRRVFRQMEMSQIMCAGNPRSYFSPAMKETLPRHKLEVWPGYSLNIDHYEGGLFVQMDVASKVFRTQTVLDLLTSLTRTHSGSSLVDNAKRALVGNNVLTRYNNRTYRIEDVDFESCPMSTFEMRRQPGTHITYYEYYRNNYNSELKDLKQPLLKSTIRTPNGEPEERLTCYLVPELCFLMGMSEQQRQDFRVMKDVAEFTRHAPPDRENKVAKFFQAIREKPDVQQIFDNWGLRISDRMTRLKGRVVTTPTLHFGGNHKEAVGPKADWGRATTSKPALKTVPWTKWTLVIPAKEKAAAKTFVDTLLQVGPKMGIRPTRPNIVEIANGERADNYLKVIKDLPKDTQIVATIFPGGVQKADRYAAIKKLCYVDQAMPCQVVMAKTLSNERRAQAVVQKVALQMLCKLGGELWGLSVPMKHLCVVGIDVYRDKGTSKNAAAVVVSMNGSFSKYFSQIVFESNNTLDLTGTLKAAMLHYRHLNDTCPERVIVYRDGVPGGHCSILSNEALALERVMEELVTDGVASSKPAMSYVLVQKRTNQKIFDVTKGRLENAPAGTVLDHTITARAAKDFYLVPMTVTQGTATPTHYIIMHEPVAEDPLYLRPDVMQKITFALTHLYFNWPGNVKVPAPCQYAHKLVEMVGEHLHKKTHDALADTLFYL